MIGIVLQVVALVAVSWITFSTGRQSVSLGFVDVFRQLPSDSSGLAEFYVQALAILATVLAACVSLVWTLGAYRGARSARLLSGIRSRELTRANFGRYRFGIAARAGVMLVVHLAGIIAMYGKDLSAIGPGPYLLLGGGVLIVVGAAIGPRPGPGMH
ncbi:hypothetical protein GCM10022222_29900 [Amycolatopsis ultiminotia]|uniref:Uncharacterized protein n=1 Tax=Amycolatopsis ultiminotia TaxID=543629 RepID=A0ABP6W3B2_9PSEU